MMVPHVAAGLGVPSSADHGGLHGAAPPVATATDAVLHHGQQDLLQAVGDRAVGCNTRWPLPVSHLGNSREAHEGVGAVFHLFPT